MPTRVLFPSLLAWALLLVVPLACTRQTAIVLSGTADSAVKADVVAPTATSTSTSTATSNVLFSDDFSNGYADNWQLSVSNDGPVSNTADGSNQNVTLDSTNHDFTRLRANLDGAQFEQVDITASMRFKVEQPPLSKRSVRLDVRQASSTENIFYAVGAVIAEDNTISKASVFKKVDDGDGSYTICALSEYVLPSPPAAAEWHSLKLTVVGETKVSLTAYFDDAQVAAYVDDCTSSLTSTAGDIVPNGGCLANQTAIGIQVEKGMVASVDDVLVTLP